MFSFFGIKAIAQPLPICKVWTTPGGVETPSYAIYIGNKQVLRASKFLQSGEAFQNSMFDMIRQVQSVNMCHGAYVVQGKVHPEILMNGSPYARSHPREIAELQEFLAYEESNN